LVLIKKINAFYILDFLALEVTHILKKVQRIFIVIWCFINLKMYRSIYKGLVWLSKKFNDAACYLFIFHYSVIIFYIYKSNTINIAKWIGKIKRNYSRKEKILIASFLRRPRTSSREEPWVKNVRTPAGPRPTIVFILEII
jgi:hypothetical protein